MLNESTQQLFLPLCLLPTTRKSHVFPTGFISLVARVRKGCFAHKNNRLEEAWPLIELILIRTSVSPLHPSTPRGNIAGAHIHRAKTSFLLLAPVGRSMDCPLLCSNTLKADSLLYVTLPSKSQQKMKGRVFQLGFRTGWKDSRLV